MWQKQGERDRGREVLLPGRLHVGLASWGLAQGGRDRFLEIDT